MGGNNMPGVIDHLHAELQLTFIQPTCITVNYADLAMTT